MDLSLLNSHRQVIRDEDTHNNEKKEPEQLFQESWFFGNLLQTSRNKPKTMLRSFSDPIASSSSSNKSYEETYRSIKKVSLMSPTVKGIDPNIRRSKSSSSSSLDSEEDEYDQDEEIEFSMGELIRQASMKSSDSCSFNPNELTPRSRQRSVNKHELDIIINNSEEEGSEDVIPQVPMRQLQPQKSLTSTLKSEELQGFKDLGFEFDQLYLDTTSTIRTPNNNRVKNRRHEEKNTKHSWCYNNMHSSAPPALKWGATSSEIMKERIKFWARSVAYNVRQEC